ncbi:hypothetical protein Sango_2572400 [Sesamum angolense]|uniref:Uncharacterized protein n=1 Tax=Sesamum angolense TaxID=2727404 RepID=A0AAE2BIU9_9LAMI|nr:hypothetical protein Sango_2572400 [Sesamum angolense]
MGGGAMRVAAKVAGFTASSGGLRGIAAEHYSVSSAARRAASVRPPAATVEDVKLVTSQVEAGVQRPCLEMDDWVFAGGEEDAVVGVAEPMPRVVFGGVPTLQEARDATSELTAALDKTYLSSPGSFVVDHGSSLSLSDKQVAETKACVTTGIAVAPAVPAPAIMAFRFLSESSAAQNVVASIACDPNVWNAVLQNQELQEFLQSQKTSCSSTNLNLELVADSDNLDQEKTFDDSPKHANGYKDFFQKIRSTIVGMMSGLSDFFQNFFGGKGTNRVVVDSDGTARVTGDTWMEASFMGLAVMAILVIVLKRA